MMSLKSFFLPKELWSCNHPKTESFRVNSVIGRRNANSGYEAASDLRNWLEFDSSEASTSSNSEDSGVMPPELAVDGLVRGLCSDRLFFEPNCTKSIAAAGRNEKTKTGLSGGNMKPRNGLERETNDGFLPFKENTKMVAGFKVETSIIAGEVSSRKQNASKKFVNGFEVENGVITDEFSLLKENIKTVSGVRIKSNINGSVATLKEHLKAADQKNHHTRSFQDDDHKSMTKRKNKEDGGIEDMKSSSILRGRTKTNINSSSSPFRIGKNAEPVDTINAKRDRKGVHRGLALEESLMLVMDSMDPYMDFRVSMEEMVEAFGLEEWACLEEMLQWYLSVNSTTTHRYILGAFVDLLVSIVLSVSPSCSQEQQLD